VTILALETSCDDTSAAVVRNGRILSNIVSSQIRVHSEYGGVVPELATREHLRNLQTITHAAFEETKLSIDEIDAVAATQGPGLPNALMVGFKAAQAIGFAARKPFVGIHHVEAHLYSPWIGADGIAPNVSLIVSGGHTLLVHVRGPLDHQVLGSTLDDAAGECFDKTGKMLGLAYPAGPEIDRLAERGNLRAYGFPRPLLNDPSDDFSFAGLKTSVRYFLEKQPSAPVHDVCASVQAAIVDVLVQKTVRAAKRLGVRTITASGGVTSNRALRRDLAAACEREGFRLRLADRAVCTDNAGMIGILAEMKLRAGKPETALDANIAPTWELSS
jgi:tRNA N6-adenosine threonylcarbamoyltransferase